MVAVLFFAQKFEPRGRLRRRPREVTILSVSHYFFLDTRAPSIAKTPTREPRATKPVAGTPRVTVKMASAEEIVAVFASETSTVYAPESLS